MTSVKPKPSKQVWIVCQTQRSEWPPHHSSRLLKLKHIHVVCLWDWERNVSSVLKWNLDDASDVNLSVIVRLGSFPVVQRIIETDKRCFAMCVTGKIPTGKKILSVGSQLFLLAIRFNGDFASPMFFFCPVLSLCCVLYFTLLYLYFRSDNKWEMLDVRISVLFLVQLKWFLLNSPIWSFVFMCTFMFQIFQRIWQETTETRWELKRIQDNEGE